MSLKHGVILWCSGSLTAFVMMGLFWTIFRNELDAARSLVIKANETFEQAERTMNETAKMSQQLRDLVETASRDIRHEVGRDREEIQSLLYRVDATVGQIQQAMQKIVHKVDDLR